MLTIDRLMTIMTPKEKATIHIERKDNISLSRDVYEVRKQYLNSQLNRILDVLQMNYWNMLSECLKNTPSTASPINVLSKMRNMDFNTINSKNTIAPKSTKEPTNKEPTNKEPTNNNFQQRCITMIYNYLIDIYSIIGYLQIIDTNVINSIEYSEAFYE